MDSIILWIIIIGFYAPLHYLLPVLLLFITGDEPEFERKAMTRRAIVDATLSMVLAFVVAIGLVQIGQIGWAMLCLLVSMPLPFVRIVRQRRLVG